MIKSLILSLIIMVAVVGCNDDRQVPQENRILRYDIPAPVGSLNPLQTDSSGSTFVYPFLFSYLCIPDEKGDLQPDLAVSWVYDPSALNWTIEIRENARFHDSTPVTSEDVKFSIQNYLTGPKGYVRETLKSIDIISSTRISMQLNQGDPDFINKIWDMCIVPELIAESKVFSDSPIGSGPFKFKLRQGDQLVDLVANNEYYAGMSPLEGVIFSYQADKEKSWTRLLAGKTDIAHEITPKNYQIMSYLKDRFHFNIYTLPWYSILLYNTKDPLFSDVRVRQALTHAINRPYIVEKMLTGYGKIAKGPMGIDTEYSNQKLMPLSYDPQKSMDLLRLAGWSLDEDQLYLQKDGRIFEFTILCFKEGFIPIRIANYIKLNLFELGIIAHVQILPYEEIVGRYVGNNQFQAVLTEFNSDNSRPEFFLKLWTPVSCDGSLSGCFEDKEVTRLTRLMVAENNPEKIKALCHQIEARIAFLQPGTFLYHKTIIDVMSNRISLPSPFSLTQEGASRLWRATVK